MSIRLESTENMRHMEDEHRNYLEEMTLREYTHLDEIRNIPKSSMPTRMYKFEVGERKTKFEVLPTIINQAPIFVVHEDGNGGQHKTYIFEAISSD